MSIPYNPYITLTLPQWVPGSLVLLLGGPWVFATSSIWAYKATYSLRKWAYRVVVTKSHGPPGEETRILRLLCLSARSADLPHAEVARGTGVDSGPVGGYNVRGAGVRGQGFRVLS